MNVGGIPCQKDPSLAVIGRYYMFDRKARTPKRNLTKFAGRTTGTITPNKLGTLYNLLTYNLSCIIQVSQRGLDPIIRLGQICQLGSAFNVDAQPGQMFF